jgi:hypothetical protein
MHQQLLGHLIATVIWLWVGAFIIIQFDNEPELNGWSKRFVNMKGKVLIVRGNCFARENLTESDSFDRYSLFLHVSL